MGREGDKNIECQYVQHTGGYIWFAQIFILSHILAEERITSEVAFRVANTLSQVSFAESCRQPGEPSQVVSSAFMQVLPAPSPPLLANSSRDPVEQQHQRPTEGPQEPHRLQKDRGQDGRGLL